MDGDLIEIAGLRVVARIGATPEERARPQALELWLRLVPVRGFAELGDDLGRTVDYFAVSERVRGLAASGERILIETLADEMAAMVLSEFAVRAVRVEVRKFVLADCGYVAVRTEKTS